MEERQIEVLMEQADVQRRLSNWRGAIDLLQRALSLDPDHARAHASLSLALLGARRLPGAGIEARMSLSLDGNDAYCHYAAAAVMAAERKLEDAWAHCLVAIETETDDIDARVLGAHIRGLRNETAEARVLLEEALELQPNHTEALTGMARLELEAHRYDVAQHYIDQALRADPSDHEAHVVAGYIALVRKDPDAAEGHARFVLGQDATDQEAIRLWAAIKASRSLVLGLWWRFSAWVSLRSETGQLAMMLGAFVLVRIAIILASHFDLDRIEAALTWGWLGFCAYTWFAPELFRWMLQRDLGTVVLDPEF